MFIEGYIREECGGKVLSVRRNCRKDSPSVSKTYYGTRQGRVHYPDEHMNTLATDGHNGGGGKSLSNPRTVKRLGSYNGHQSGNVYSDDGLSPGLCATDYKAPVKIKRERVVKKVGNFSPSGHYGKNVYADDGLCPTLCSGSVVKNGLNIRESKS